MNMRNDFHEPIRVMLADDQQIVLWALHKLIGEQDPHFEVVATGSTCSEILSQARACTPDVIVLDINLESGEGAMLLPQLMAGNHARVLLFTSTRDENLIDRAMHDGARGLVSKEGPPHLLVDAIRKVHEGEIWVDRQTTSRLLTGLSQGDRSRAAQGPWAQLRLLTPRELMILQTMAELPGARNKRIANHLGISEHTLRNHLSAIFDKLDISSRFQLFSFVNQNLPMVQTLAH